MTSSLATASKKQSEIPRKFLGGLGHNPLLAGPPTNYAPMATTDVS